MTGPRTSIGLVRDWMTHRPVTASPELTVAQVARLMRGEGIRHVLIVEEGRLAGIVSTRDLHRLPGEEVRAVSPATPVGEIMTEGPVTVSPDAPLTEAARAMLEGKIGALPVVEDDRPIGILSLSDAFEALLLWAEER